MATGTAVCPYCAQNPLTVPLATVTGEVDPSYEEAKSTHSAVEMYQHLEYLHRHDYRPHFTHNCPVAGHPVQLYTDLGLLTYNGSSGA